MRNIKKTIQITIEPEELIEKISKYQDLGYKLYSVESNTFGVNSMEGHDELVTSYRLTFFKYEGENNEK